MMIRVTETGTVWPYSLERLRVDEPARSFSASPSDAELAWYGVFRVAPRSRPDHDPSQVKPVEVAPALTDGQWQQQWELVPLTDAEKEAYCRAAHPPRWLEFGAAVQGMAQVNSMLAAALDAAPALAMALSVGLGKAADGDSRVFLSAWQAVRGQGLVSAELTQGLQLMATQHDLPPEFVAGLGEVQA